LFFGKKPWNLNFFSQPPKELGFGLSDYMTILAMEQLNSAPTKLLKIAESG
jgi:hypothetical protein